MIIGIVCVDKNWGIGKNNDLLFHLKKDMQFFRQTTADSIVFCGYNTLLTQAYTPIINLSQKF